MKKHGQIIWDHTLDGYEMLPDEFEFYLSRILFETTPEQDLLDDYLKAVPLLKIDVDEIKSLFQNYLSVDNYAAG
ncbi:MAG: hypothetical protein L0H53_12490 [Candidatus Nitrosocosmicus sp.]|nr:hypothetical protein [Candidatus Nitrosocosmicus sp.]MDN5868298.1 hypothetical protein [Candidatus Nitrosocosmicus sp.]